MKAFFVKNLGAISGIVIAVILFTSVIISYFLYVHQPDITDTRNSSTVSEHQADTLNSVTGKSKTVPAKVLSFEDKLVLKLKEMYGETISEKKTQLLLLKVKQNLLKKFPETGQTIFYNVIKRAFPEFADEILKTLSAMEAYLKWEEENKPLTAEMNILEKQGFLWKKRKELFGLDAEEIWTKEVEAYEKRKEEMQNVISRLNQSDDTTIYEKLDDYQKSLTDVYENSPEAYILKSKDLLSKVFLSLDSIQAELKEMTPDERRTELYNIRREMGYTQEQIEALEKIDTKKNNRWENGLAYMEEREKITQGLEGEELKTALDSLREKYFKHESKTIEREEASGFFRYTRKRIYGKN